MLLFFQSSGLCVQSPSIIPVPGYPLCHFPIGILGQVWYLIVSIPDLCNLTYFGYPQQDEFPSDKSTNTDRPFGT